MLKFISALALLVWFLFGAVIVYYCWKFAALKIASMGAPLAGGLAALSIFFVIPGLVFGWLGAVEFGGYEHWEVAIALFGPQALMMAVMALIGTLGAVASKLSKDPEAGAG